MVTCGYTSFHSTSTIRGADAPRLGRFGRLLLLHGNLVLVSHPKPLIHSRGMLKPSKTPGFLKGTIIPRRVANNQCLKSTYNICRKMNLSLFLSRVWKLHSVIPKVSGNPPIIWRGGCLHQQKRAMFMWTSDDSVGFLIHSHVGFYMGKAWSHLQSPWVFHGTLR